MRRRIYIVGSTEKQLEEMIEGFKHHGFASHCFAFVHPTYLAGQATPAKKVAAIDINFDLKCDLCTENCISHFVSLDDIAKSKYLCKEHLETYTGE